jgi:cell division protein FtsB
MQRLLAHPITIVAITVLTILFFTSLDKNSQTAQTSIKNLQALDQQTKSLETEVKNLESQVQSAQTNLSKEKIIRNELLLQKEGEFVVQLPADLGAVKMEEAQVKQETAWEGWKKVFMD